MEPVSPLHIILKLVKLIKFPISGGIEPVNPQNPHDNVSRFIKSPICGGISPRSSIPVTGLPERVILVVSSIL